MHVTVKQLLFIRLHYKDRMKLQQVTLIEDANSEYQVTLTNCIFQLGINMTLF